MAVRSVPGRMTKSLTTGSVHGRGTISPGWNRCSPSTQTDPTSGRTARRAPLATQATLGRVGATRRDEAVIRRVPKSGAARRLSSPAGLATQTKTPSPPRSSCTRERSAALRSPEPTSPNRPAAAKYQSAPPARRAALGRRCPSTRCPGGRAALVIVRNLCSFPPLATTSPGHALVLWGSPAGTRASGTVATALLAASACKRRRHKT